MQVDVPVRCTFVVSGNNFLLSSELARRTVLIKLDANMPDPTVGRRFKYSDLKHWVRVNRGTLVWACLTLIQAWIAAGKPMGDATLASYEQWSHVMGGILKVIGVDGFLQDREEVRTATGDSDAPARAFVRAWWARFQNQETTIGNLACDAEVPESPEAAKNLVSLLHHYKGEIDLGFNHHRLSSWQSALGKFIGRAKDRVFEFDEAKVKIRHRKTNQGARVHLEPMQQLGSNNPTTRDIQMPGVSALIAAAPSIYVPASNGRDPT